MKNKNTKIPQMVLALRSVLLYVLLLSTTQTLQAQSWQWANGGGSSDDLDSNYEEKVKSMCTDVFGNVYITSPVGRSNTQIAGVPKSTYATFGVSDAVLASFSCDGSYRWSKVIGGYSGSEPAFIGSDGYGNIYATGYATPAENSNELVHFDTDYIVPFDPTAFKSMYLVKYNAQGDFMWLRYPEGPNTNYFNNNYGASLDLSVDSQGNTYLLCTLKPNTYGGTNGFVVSNQGLYILKYDINGGFVGGIDLNIQYSGDIDARMKRHPVTGAFYIAGEFDPTEPNRTMIINGEMVTHSKYIAAFSNTGAFLWKRENVSLFVTGRPKLEVNSELNQVYLANATAPNSVTANTEGFNGIPFIYGDTPLPFIVAFDSNGNTAWQTNGFKGFVDGVVKNGNEVAVTGGANNMTWQNLSYQQDTNSGSHPYLARFTTATGAIVAINGVYSDGQATGTALASDSKGNYYLGGGYSYSLTAGSSTVTSIGGGSDFFVAKFGTTDCNFLATEQPEEQKLKMYPNPVKDYLHLENVTNSTYVLYDVLGAVVAKGVVSENSALNFSQLSSGLYVLEVVKNTGEKTVVKVLKE
jgi:Secretion system C-terminal sorting domain